MPSYTGTVETTKAPDDVFHWLAAFEHTAEWDPNCERAERLTPGDVAVGTRFKLIFNPIGSVESEFEYEVVEHDVPARRIKLRGGSGQVDSEDTITVAPGAAGGAVVTYHADLKGKGVAKLAEPLIGLGLQRAGVSAEKGLAERLAEPLA